jgi:hypothetical protein
MIPPQPEFYSVSFYQTNDLNYVKLDVSVSSQELYDAFQEVPSFRFSASDGQTVEQVESYFGEHLPNYYNIKGFITELKQTGFVFKVYDEDGKLPNETIEKLSSLGPLYTFLYAKKEQ